MPNGFFTKISEALAAQYMPKRAPVVGPQASGKPREKEQGLIVGMVIGAIILGGMLISVIPQRAGSTFGDLSAAQRSAVLRDFAPMGLFGAFITIVSIIQYIQTRRRRLTVERLKISSMPVEGEIVGKRRGSSTKSSSAIRYLVRWLEPRSGQVVTKPSDDVWYAPYVDMTGRKVRVLTDLDDPRAYYVELEPLFAEKPADPPAPPAHA